MGETKTLSFERGVISLATFTFAHFAIDFACAFLLMRMLRLGVFPEAKVWGYFIVYNALAFGPQFIIGSFFRLRDAWIGSCAGCLMLALGVGLGSYVVSFLDVCREGVLPFSSATLEKQTLGLSLFSLTSILLAGVGNAFFHVGGGIDALARNIGLHWRAGVFISTGDLGIFWGGLAGMKGDLPFGTVVALLMATMVLVGFGGRDISKENNVSHLEGETEKERKSVDETIERYARLFYDDARLFPLFVALGVVATRCFIGFVSPRVVDSFSGGGVTLMEVASASFVGKFCGGFIADRLGARKTGVAALLLAVPCLYFSGDLFFFLTGVFLLNTTTSITVVSAAKSCVGRVGFAFGTTTLALLAGFLASDVAIQSADFVNDALFIRIALSALLCASAVGLFFSLRPVNKQRNA